MIVLYGKSLYGRVDQVQGLFYVATSFFHIYNKCAAFGTLGRLQEALHCFEESQRLGDPQAEQAVEACRRALNERQPTGEAAHG